LTCDSQKAIGPILRQKSACGERRESTLRSIEAIRTGLWADLIAVDGDPPAGIRQLEHVTFVMPRRTVCSRAGR
jgi:hypothetical protein